MITSDTMLTHILSIALQKALKRTMEALVEIVQGYVQSEVYDAYDPLVYKRRHDLFGKGGFYESWTYSEVESMGGALGGDRTFISKIFSDAKSMDFIPDEHVHGAYTTTNIEFEDEFMGTLTQPVMGLVDRRENLDEYIAEGAAYDFIYESGEQKYAKPRDYWSPVIDLLNAGFLGDIFETACEEVGLPVIKGW